jgi:hypothetical protein
VETNPPGASVFIDDDWIGVSPVNGDEVAVGTKVLRVELAGYRTVFDTLSVEVDEREELSFDLVELTGDLQVLSDPPGAAVSFDGERTDLVTPVLLRDVSVNASHRLDLILTGYRTGVHDGIRVYEDSTVTITHSFAKMDGAVSIVSQPAEASVYLDGDFVGSTPCILETVPYGRHGLQISKAGYSVYAEDIDVSERNQQIEVSLDLLPPGKIIFNIEPYATLSINGNLIREDVTYHEIELAPGRYTILLQHSQLGDYSEEVELESDASVTIRHRFAD